MDRHDALVKATEVVRDYRGGMSSRALNDTKTIFELAAYFERYDEADVELATALLKREPVGA
jgi:hypothetical protein